MQDYSRGSCSLEEMRRSGSRSHSQTEEGCIVSWTTVTRWLLNCSRSTSSRSVALKLASVLAASYLLCAVLLMG